MNNVCLEYTVECVDGAWTVWFDRDNPGGTGDWETTSLAIELYGDNMCTDPSAIQVHTLDGIPAEDTDEIFLHYSPDIGFVCRMADQPDNTCLDYRVRYCCPANPPCDGEWSQWFDEDSPEEGIGDLETLATLCEKTCKRPSAIQAQTIDGIPAELTGDVLLSNDIINGFACLNEEQDDEKCEDYKVRFCCPEQPDCDKWTKWFNTDKPCEGLDADREITAVIQDEYPNEMCKNPLFIQVVVAATEQPSSSTGQVFLHHDVDPGFVCLDKDQPAGDQCHDYKVRYCCDEQLNKPGQCTMVPSIDDVRPKGYCYYDCQDDTDCQGKKKCCASGICGTICMDPVFICFHEGVIFQEAMAEKILHTCSY
ncbi:uncharacterized protein LOC100367634 [Saccoglossus kowalevskii]|uniref:Uncharacterized protein LOC100367634 n=1 Tax=Saccoglossus kowalevskii TaxID=10224 RepID=A0ABM0GXM7_SACKO|nr:PREDICTED: uncharacterized protein LOC100367634 [Saccoglossus kowalevskii]